MPQIKQWRDGQQVTGLYCGVPYVGNIVDHGEFSSRRAPRGDAFIFVVDLAEPITVFGEQRTHITVWTNSDTNTIQLS